MIFIVALSILVLISLVGNTLVILTVLINKPMQTTLNYLLVNLAVADMTFALFIGIQYVMMPFIAHPEGETGRYLCRFVTDGAIAWVGAAVSILCLVYIAVERYFAIIHPLRQRGRFTRRRLKVFIVLAWSFAILMNVPAFMDTRYFQPDQRLCKRDGNFGYVEAKVDSLVWMVLAGIVPVSIMVYLYSRVVHHLWFKPVENLDASQRASLRYRKQVAITLITVSLIYAVSWIPNLTAYVLKSWGGVVMGSWYDKSGRLSVTFNSCINPVLYSMRMKCFREHLRDMLLCKKRQTVGRQAAVVHVGPTTGQPNNGTEISARNTAAPTPFLFSSGEITTTETSLNVVKSRREYLTICGAAADKGNIVTATCTLYTECKGVTVDAGTDCSTCLQENMKSEKALGALATIETFKAYASQQLNNYTETCL
ncbi:QRFP-like peptide receptor [Oculina patagonica]